MACFGSLHEAVTDPAHVQDSIRELEAFVLCGFDFDGDLPA
jgi:hypothetical protein